MHLIRYILATESLLQGYIKGKHYELCHHLMNHSQWFDIYLDPWATAAYSLGKKKTNHFEEPYHWFFHDMSCVLITADHFANSAVNDYDWWWWLCLGVFSLTLRDSILFFVCEKQAETWNLLELFNPSQRASSLQEMLSKYFFIACYCSLYADKITKVCNALPQNDHRTSLKVCKLCYRWSCD